MKILLLTSAMDSGGAETHVLTLSSYLKKRGHSVCLVSSGGKMEKALISIGVKTRTVDLLDRSISGVIRAVAEVLGICKSLHPDIIHAHGRYPDFIGNIAAKALSIPLVTTAHAYNFSSLTHKKLSAWGEHVIAVSPDIKEMLCREYGIYPDRIRVIPNGIDTVAFSPMKRTSPKRRIVFMSRLDKDCSLAAHILCDNAPELYERSGVEELIICGGGEELQCLREKARSAEKMCGGKLTIRLTGQLTDPKSVISEASLFVGVSRAALEAMSMGIPTLLFGNEGMLGVFDEHLVHTAIRTNFCCRNEKPPRPRALLAEIHRFFSFSEETRRRIGEFSRHYVTCEHSLEAMGRATEAVYLEVTRRHSHSESKGRCLLCGYYGFGNTGDDALLSGAIERAHLEGYEKIVAMTKRGGHDTKKYGIKCVRRDSPLSVISELVRSDTFIFGGGTLIQDSTSLRSLLYYTSLLKLASAIGVRCELWANGIGDLRCRASLVSAVSALSECSHVGARDGYSLARAERLLKRGGSHILPKKENDLGADTSPTDKYWGNHILLKYGIETPFVIIAPNGNRTYAEFKRELTTIRAILRDTELTPVTVSMFEKEDSDICRRITSALGGVYIPRITSEEFVFLASRAHSVIGSRLHSLILAGAADTHFIRLCNDRKLLEYEQKDPLCRSKGENI